MSMKKRGLSRVSELRLTHEGFSPERGLAWAQGLDRWTEVIHARGYLEPRLEPDQCKDGVHTGVGGGSNRKLVMYKGTDQESKYIKGNRRQISHCQIKKLQM